MKEVLCLMGLAKKVKVQDQVVLVYYDKNSVMQYSNNQVYHERMKHINVKLQFVREEIGKGFVVANVLTDHKSSNMITKVLPDNKFFHFRDLIQLIGD